MVNSNGKLALVTGADGFIGSHLTEALLARGYRVRALAQYNSFNDWGWLEDVKASDRLEIVCGDVRDPNFCREISRGTDIIFHLAALIAIPYSYTAPDSYVDTNIRGTLNMCQAARDEHVGRLVHTFGPRQSARAIIPTIITQIASGKERIRLGDLTPTRDFNFVEDTAAGFIALAEAQGIEGMEINIATGKEYSMGQTLEMISTLMGKPVEQETDPERLRPANSEVNRLCGDNTLITSLTDWRPRFSFEEGLKRTIDWFVRPENLAKYKPDIYNR